MFKVCPFLETAPTLLGFPDDILGLHIRAWGSGPVLWPPCHPAASSPTYKEGTDLKSHPVQPFHFETAETEAQSEACEWAAQDQGVRKAQKKELSPGSLTPKSIPLLQIPKLLFRPTQKAKAKGFQQIEGEKKSVLFQGRAPNYYFKFKLRCHDSNLILVFSFLHLNSF